MSGTDRNVDNNTQEPENRQSETPRLDLSVVANDQSAAPPELAARADEKAQLDLVSVARDADMGRVNTRGVTHLHGVMFTDDSAPAPVKSVTANPEITRVSGTTSSLPPADNVLALAKDNFQVFDKNDDKHITAEEVDQFINEKGADYTPEQVAELRRLKEAVEKIEEASNDETGDENDGMTAADIEKVLEHLSVVDFAEKNFDRLDTDSDGHVTAEDVDRYINARSGQLQAPELEMLQKVKENIDDLEGKHDDEFGIENDGFTRHDLADARTEYGVFAFKAMAPASPENAPPTMQEAIEYAKQNFPKMDKDGDGHLTSEDIDKYVEENKANLTAKDLAQLEMFKGKISELEEQSNDETGDENDGVTNADLDESLKKIQAVEYAQDNFEKLDGNGDGHITADEIDGYVRARGGVSADEHKHLEWLKNNLDDLEEYHDDETFDENDGFTKHDLLDTLSEIGASTRKPRVERQSAPAEPPGTDSPPNPEPKPEQEQVTPPRQDNPEGERTEPPAANNPADNPQAEQPPQGPRNETWGQRQFQVQPDGSAVYEVRNDPSNRDSLWKVAREVLKHRNSGQEPNPQDIVKMVRDIVTATNNDNDPGNDIRNPDRIYPGQRLVIPPPPGQAERPAAPEGERRTETPDGNPQARNDGERDPYSYHGDDGGQQRTPLHDPSLERPPQPEIGRVSQGRVEYPEERPGEGPWNRRRPAPVEPPPIPDRQGRPRGSRIPMPGRERPEGQPDGEPPPQPQRRESVPPQGDQRQDAVPPAQPQQQQFKSIFQLMKENFGTFDKDGDKFITGEELDKFMEENKDKVDPKTLEKLKKVRERIDRVEELSNDETGDENNGIHASDLEEAIKEQEMLDYATRNFDRLDTDGDGHVSEADIDQYMRARQGELSAGELETLKRMKEKTGDLEEANDDEFLDENDGFTRHDLLEYARENGIDVDEKPGSAMDPTAAQNAGMPNFIDQAGYLASIKQQFKDFDADGNGHVTPEEIDKFMEKHKDKLNPQAVGILQRMKEQVEKIEELSNDETGDENDGFTEKDLDIAIASAQALEYAKRNFEKLDNDNDGHITENDIDAYLKANSGNISPREAELLQKLKERIGEFESGHDDEFGIENDGVTKHDLIAIGKELGLA